MLLVAEPADHPMPKKSTQVTEGRLGDPMAEVVGPPSQYRVEPVDEGGERLVRRPLRRSLNLGLHWGQCGLGGIGVHVVLRRASLLVPLDTESEEVEALVDVDDPRLLLRQAQAHR